MTDAEAQALINFGFLDLVYPVSRATASNEWRPDVARLAEQRYRDFLYVCWYTWKHEFQSAYVLTQFSRLADAVWHEHILVTPAYRRDCEAVFAPGSYLDHQPSDYPGDGIAAPNLAVVQTLTEGYYDRAGRPYVQPPDPDFNVQCAWCLAP